MLRDYVDWWRAQMLDLVPPRLREAAADETDALYVTAETLGDPPTVALTLLRGRREGTLGRFMLDAAGTELARAAALVPGRTHETRLRLPGGLLLEKHLTLPLAAERELARVVGYEMDRETPFTADEVWWSVAVEQRDKAQGRLGVRLSLLPRATIAGLLERLTAAGIAPGTIELPAPDGEARLLPLGAAAGPQRRWFARPSQLRPLPLAAASCALLASIAVVLPFIRQAVELAQIEGRIATLKPDVDAAEKIEKQLAGSGSGDVVRAERIRLGDALKVLAATTTLLPDDTYLTDFTMQQRKVTLNGQSPSPAKLIGLISADAAFKDPSFEAPVTHLPGAQKDGFSIGAEAKP